MCCSGWFKFGVVNHDITFSFNLFHSQECGCWVFFSSAKQLTDFKPLTVPLLKSCVFILSNSSRWSTYSVLLLSARAASISVRKGLL